MYISFWIEVVSWYGAQIFNLCGYYEFITLWLLVFGIPWERSFTIGEWRARVSSYPVRGNPALCWQSSGLVLGDVFPEAFSCGNGKFLGLTICWKSKEPIRNLYGISCRTYHSLMVSQHCLDGSYSRHSSKCLCWLRFIFYFRNNFLHYALVIISNVSF